MRRLSRGVCLWFAGLLILPTMAYAQASIAGIVKDSSGAVLPGVTVEAASPALIEKVRTVVTDGTGQFKMVDLRPGSYTVTFTIAGFSTVKREGIELTGSFVATVSADMKLGAVEETIMVSGAAPIVDVQSVTKQVVLNHDIIDAIPTGKRVNDLAILVPGVALSGGLSNQDVGGSNGGNITFIVAHGSKSVDSGINVNGIQWGSIQGHGAGRTPNMLTFQEVAVDTASASAELPQAGPMINYTPREGGNSFKGSVYADFTNHSMQSSNVTQDLISRGLPLPNSNLRNYDSVVGLGGPLREDKLWFYGSARRNGTNGYVGGNDFVNRNAGNPDVWTLDPDTSQPATATGTWNDMYLRLTWQLNAKNKIAISHDVQNRCTVRPANNASPEAAPLNCFPQMYASQGDWTLPLTSRVLLQVGGQYALETYNNKPQTGALNVDKMISVTDQFTGWTYRAPTTYSNNMNGVLYPRVALSYVTGAHAFKVGYNDQIGSIRGANVFNGPPLNYRFNNGVPNQVTEYAAPYLVSGIADIKHGLGLYAQDKWTVDRMTLNLGLRYDLRSNGFSEERFGPGPLVPTRNLVYAAQSNEHLSDIEPRLGMALDMFGSGTTALKVTLNKYVVGGTGIGNSANNPVSTLVNSTTRTWNDANHNFVPDCNLTTPTANSECGTMANTNFGTSVPGSSQDPALLSGWGRRSYNWEFSTGIQQRLATKVSMEASYFRRWYGNFSVSDDLSVSASDFDTFSITAPVNPLLPNGGGYTVSGLYNLKPAKFGVPSNNYVTFSDNYGNQTEHWNGVDLSMNARMSSGLLMQGGLSTGRTVTDNCDIIAKLPELSPSTPSTYCHNSTGFRTQVKLVGTYTVPKALVQLSAVYQDIPGDALSSNYTATNAVIRPSLGRDLSGGANSTIAVNLIAPGSLFGERLHQLDLRFGKILKFGKTRAAVNLDLYNALNGNPVIVESSTYSTFRQPQQVLLARFAKVSMTLDF